MQIFNITLLVVFASLLLSCYSCRSATSVTVVKPGIDSTDLSIFNGHQIGLITNPSGVTYNFTATIDLLFSEKNKFKLVALFSPEHGLRGDQPPGKHTTSYTDPITGLPVFSLYGNNLAPTPEQLKNISLLVFDLQDVGVRCYTFMSTLAHSLKAAAENKVPFVVIDRVNPIGASEMDVNGPVLDLEYKSFIGIWTIPLQHGMTMGELALMFNAEMEINHPNLHILKVQGDYSQRLPLNSYVGTAWLPPSPNLPTLESSFLYPGMVLFEALGNVSLGRGTATPFQIVGAPFMDPYALLNHLNNVMIPRYPELKVYLSGVVLIPSFWVPTTDVHAGVQCAGIRILVVDRSQVNSIGLALTLVRSIVDLYSTTQLQFSSKGFNIRMGYNAAQQIMDQTPVSVMMQSWKPDLSKFFDRRSKYLLY